MRKSYKLSRYYYKHAELLHSGITQYPASGTALLQNGVESTVPILSLASSKKLPLTWSIVRYYRLEHKKHAQNIQNDPLQNILGKQCPEVLNGGRAEFLINTREKVRRRISYSKWQPFSLTQPRYGEENIRGFIAPAVSAANSSRLFHSSSQLPKSDNVTPTGDPMASEDLTIVGEPVPCEDGYVPRNIAGTLSLFQKNKHHLDDETDVTKSVTSRSDKFRNEDIHLTNLVRDSSDTCDDKTLKETGEISNMADTETQRQIPRKRSGERNDNSMISKRGSHGKRLNEVELNLKQEDAVQEKVTDKVVGDIDKKKEEKGRKQKKPSILPPVNAISALNKNIDQEQEKMKKRKKEKDDKSPEERKNVKLTNKEKSVEEGKKKKEKLDSKSKEDRTLATNGEDLKVNNGDGDEFFLSNEGSELVKVIENIAPNITEAVAKYGLKPVTEGYTCLVTRCPKLSKKVNKDKPHGNLYINATSGHFQCDECQQYGSWTTLQHNFERILNTQKKLRPDFPCMTEIQGKAFLKLGSKEIKTYLSLGLAIDKLEQSERELVLEKFQCEKLSLLTLNRHNVKYLKEDEALLLPYYLSDKTPICVKKLTSSPEEDSTSIEQEFISQLGKCHLFGWNRISKNDDSIVLTASEFDAMAITESEKGKALSLPLGISSLPIESLPTLERFKKILLWFEDDLLSWNAAKQFAKKLNSSRCYIIRPSLDTPSPYKALQQGLSIGKMMRNARLIMHESIVSYSSMKKEVYSELANLEMVAGTEWKRFLTLNKILKGHRRGELTVFTGPTGSGKTTFMSEYSLDLCEAGVRTLWGSFEIRNVKLAKVMLTQFAKKNLSTHLEQFDIWSKKFEHLPLFFMTFHGHQAIQDVLDAMTHAVYVHDIEHIVIDNLQFMMGAMENDKFFMQDRIISSFRNFATTMNCHITVVIHPRKEKEEELVTASVFGSGKATQEADNILILQDRRNSLPKAGKYIQVVKNRFDGDLGKMLLKFDKDAYTFSGMEQGTDRLKKQDNLVTQQTEIQNDQSERTLYSQNENGSEQCDADLPSDPGVETLDYESSTNRVEDMDVVVHRMAMSEDDDTQKRLSN